MELALTHGEPALPEAHLFRFLYYLVLSLFYIFAVMVLE
jgi:hypothetical protein